MAVHLGKIKLLGVQNLYTEEARTLVEQRVPEQQGCVFQDMGRDPVTLVLEGLLLGEDALTTLEVLRDAQLKAKPLSFAADIAVGSELTEVVVETFKARQVAGYADRLHFTLRLREYIKPPQSQEAKTKPVNESSKKAAEQWEDNTVDSADAVANPETVPEALANNPAVLDHVDTEELGASITKNMDNLSADKISDITQSIAKIDPQKNIGVLQGIKKSGGLGSFVNKFINSSKNALSKLKAAFKKIDINKLKGLAKSLIMLVKNGLNILKKLKEIKSKAIDFYNSSKNISFSWQEKDDPSKTNMGQAINKLKELIKEVKDFVALKASKELAKIAKKLNIQKLFFKLVDLLRKGLKQFSKLLNKFIPIDALVASIGLGSPLISTMNQTGKDLHVYLSQMGVEIISGDFSTLFEDINGLINKADEFFKQSVDAMETILETLGINKLPGLCKQLDGLSDALLALKKIPDNQDTGKSMGQNSKTLATT